MATGKYLIIIAGPTAIGKTELSLEMADLFDSEIISSDSRQYYKEISIGTAKPSKADQRGIPHHFIDSLSIHDDYSIGQFERDVIKMLDQRFIEKDIMIMTGGSGMHIKAITHGLDDFPEVSTEVRLKWERSLETNGLIFLQNAIREKDPAYADIVDMANSRRLIRALAVMEVGQKPFSAYLNQPSKSRSFRPIYILLERDRSQLYDRIGERVDHMLKQGLEEEARALYPFRERQALNTIGYKEFFEYFDGSIEKDSAIELIKRNSRRYAKRQMTWFRNEDHWNTFSAEEPQKAISLIKTLLARNKAN